MHPSASLISGVILALLGLTFCYIVACAVAPWGHCRKCHGTGRGFRAGRLERGWCRRCDGTGRRVRVGRRLWTWLNREYREGHR